MLTADLLRARVRAGAVRPMYIDDTDEDLIARSRALVRRFEGALGGARGALDEELKDLVGDDVTFAVTRGLCKLLHDRSKWEPASPVPAPELRRAIFEASAAAHPMEKVAGRATVITRVAEKLGMSTDQVEEGMYSDLKAEHRLKDFRALDGQDLLYRYNLALAQGMLFRATTMTIEVATKKPSRLRQLFRWLKFHQLMHRAERTKTGWRVVIDGPLSLFDQSQRYGLQMAKFLPALLLLDDWTMRADVRWRDRTDPLTFELSPSVGLKTHLNSRGTTVSREEKLLTKRITEKSEWSVSRRAQVLDLGGKDVLVPDFTMVAPDGRRAHVEIVGFWRRSYLERRLEVLSKFGPPNLVLCVSRRLATEKKSELGAFSAQVVDFAEVISLPRVLKLADRVALSP